MLLSGVRNSWDMLARNSDLYLEVSASSLAFSSKARRACSISWFLRSTSTFCSASCWAFCAKLLVGLLQLFLLRLQLGRQLLRLLQQAFGLHGGLNAVEHDADAGGELLEEGQVRSGEVAERGQLDDGFHAIFEKHRQHDHVARHGLEQARSESARYVRANR